MITIKFDPKILDRYFDLKVREQCRSCKRYNTSPQCPPHLPSVDYYKTLLPSYKYGTIIYEQFSVDIKNWKESGRNSSLTIHKQILKIRSQLFKDGIYFCTAFSAGSCKFCTKCSYPCVFPEKALIPVEGTGIDVVKLMKHFNIEVKFPVEKHNNYFRVGMILWD